MRLLGELRAISRLDLLAELLQGSLLRLELHLQLGDVLLAIHRPLEELHGGEEEVDPLAELLLLGEQLVPVLGVGGRAHGLSGPGCVAAEPLAWTLYLLSRQVALGRPRRPGLLLPQGRHLILVALGLHLVPVAVDPQVLDLQREHLDLILEAPVLDLLLDVLLVGSAQLAEQLVGVALELLQPHRLAGGRLLAAVPEVSRRRVRVH